MLIFDNKVITFDNMTLYVFDKPYTMRIRCRVQPDSQYITHVVDDIYDFTYVNNDWSHVLDGNDLQTKITDVLYADVRNVTNMSYAFAGCANLRTVNITTSYNVTNMRDMFNTTHSLKKVVLETRNVTNMSNMFYQSEIESTPVLDTRDATNMSGMFMNCKELTTALVYDTSNVTIMTYMFNGDNKLRNVPLFDTSKVTNIEGAFVDCHKVETGALALYQQASTQTNPPSNHYETFRNCGSSTVTGAAELSQIPDNWK